jgi:NitT/TauT family transport system ATP-binding protein
MKRRKMGVKSPAADERLVRESPSTSPPGALPDQVLSFRGVTFGFPGKSRPAIRDVSLDVARRKFVGVVGASGCGKSTLLNLAAGLLRPNLGEVLFDGHPIDGVNTQAAYVTQDANLLPWLTVRGNVGLALKFRRVPTSEHEERVAHWIKLVGLEGFEDHFPRELSGGMRKRCSMARALIYDPSIVLMDEPFGPLDAITRHRLQQDLLDLWQGSGGTVVFVTHDLTEAICLADEVVVMSRGPGTVRGTLPVPIERPREIASLLESREFADLHRELWELFKSELDGPTQPAGMTVDEIDA